MPYVMGDNDTELQIYVNYASDSFGPYCFFYVQDEGRGIKEHLYLETVDKFIDELTRIKKEILIAKNNRGRV